MCTCVCVRERPHTHARERVMRIDSANTPVKIRRNKRSVSLYFPRRRGTPQANKHLVTLLPEFSFFALLQKLHRVYYVRGEGASVSVSGGDTLQKIALCTTYYRQRQSKGGAAAGGRLHYGQKGG